MASWCNRYDQTRYHKPGNHTISVYLQGASRPSGWTAPVAMVVPARCASCRITTGPSGWCARSFASSTSTSPRPLHPHRRAGVRQGGRHLQLEDKTFIDDPRRWPRCRAIDEAGLAARHRSHGALPRCLDADAARLSPSHPREAPALPEVRGGLAPAVVRRVQEYLQAHLAEPVTLGELAREAGLSEYHFARMFGQSLAVRPTATCSGCGSGRGPSSCWREASPWPASPPSAASLPGPFWQPLSGGVRPEPGPVASPVVILLSQITLRLWAKRCTLCLCPLKGMPIESSQTSDPYSPSLVQPLECPSIAPPSRRRPNRSFLTVPAENAVTR